MAEKTQGILVLKLANGGQEDELLFTLNALGKGITPLKTASYQGIGYAIIKFYMDTLNPTVINGMKNFATADEQGLFERVQNQDAATVFTNGDVNYFRAIIQNLREQY